MIPVLERKMEVNITEKVYLSVDDISSTFSYGAENHPLCIKGKKIIPRSKSSGGSSPNRFQLKNNTQLLASETKVSNISKASMGIIKTVKARWREHDKNIAVRSSSIGSRHATTDRFHKSVEPLAALDLNNETREAGMLFVNQRNCRRVVVLGSPKVGKTNILRRFLNDEFEEHYEPTAEDFHRKLYYIKGRSYQMDILEAAGERDFPAKRRLSILTGDIFLLVFSVDDRESFMEVCALRDEIISAKTKLMKLKDMARVPILFCGNKVDLNAKRDIGQSEMCDFLGEGAELFEISAKDCTGLEEMFGALARLGGLPTETCPALHRTVSIDNLQYLRNSQQVKSWSRAVGLQAPCGAVQPMARRPSFTSDLQHVLGARATKRKSIEKCQIQ